jgi:hypothetical protein
MFCTLAQRRSNDGVMLDGPIQLTQVKLYVRQKHAYIKCLFATQTTLHTSRKLAIGGILFWRIYRSQKSGGARG